MSRLSLSSRSEGAPRSAGDGLVDHRAVHGADAFAVGGEHGASVIHCGRIGREHGVDGRDLRGVDGGFSCKAEGSCRLGLFPQPGVVADLEERRIDDGKRAQSGGCDDAHAHCGQRTPGDLRAEIRSHIGRAEHQPGEARRRRDYLVQGGEGACALYECHENGMLAGRRKQAVDQQQVGRRLDLRENQEVRIGLGIKERGEIVEAGACR